MSDEDRPELKQEGYDLSDMTIFAASFCQTQTWLAL